MAQAQQNGSSLREFGGWARHRGMHSVFCVLFQPSLGSRLVLGVVGYSGAGGADGGGAPRPAAAVPGAALAPRAAGPGKSRSHWVVGGSRVPYSRPLVITWELMGSGCRCVCLHAARRATVEERAQLIDKVDCFIFDCDGEKARGGASSNCNMLENCAGSHMCR